MAVFSRLSLARTIYPPRPRHDESGDDRRRLHPITCLLIAVFSFVLLVACGVPHALALAVFAGVADVLPYIGALLSIGPMVLMALTRGPVIVAVVLLLMLAYEEFESRTEGVPAEQAAAIAVEMSDNRRKEER